MHAKGDGDRQGGQPGHEAHAFEIRPTAANRS